MASNSVRDRVLNCFSHVFPDKSPGQLVNLTRAAGDGWNSLASVSLVLTVESQFSLELSEPEILRMTTFDAVVSVVENAMPKDVGEGS